jgi:hypothetical protein
MILCLIKNEKVLPVTKLQALNLLPTIDDYVEWPLLSTQDWIELKELCPFLELFKELTLYFSTTTECRMSDVCLDFEDLLVDIKLKYLDKKDEISDQLWYAANAAYSKLKKYYTKINSENFAIATVLDPRFKLDVYDTTQDPFALKASAEVAIKLAFQNYSVATLQEAPSVAPPPTKKHKRFVQDLPPQDELTIYLTEPRISGNSNPLDYWRSNKTRFPILAKMARDYLALQPTSKDVEGTFSKGRRTIPYYRRSQKASTIRNQMLVNSGYR